ncbi:UDP-glucuronic acid decarboxylase family protein [Celeribacter neptunius]|uniref:UDP-glucuronate decarboxylase n=1 Tax=Celeribacter neptunius TaxID=588602 RepID=A0A1I3PLU0_9RHOB|nr:UDP-glucuronic acid decarboxylase family protein [Celeribacter neptunius]SFJ22297.1 UDP-glucuronate decarboxylase [Celeribacter neptunius]
MTTRFDFGFKDKIGWVPSRDHVLVAGGAGFLGSNLCRRLLEGGAYVTCLDNLETGRMSNIERLLRHPRFMFMQHDIVKPIRISQPVTQIYNLACPASPPKYQIDPIKTFATNVEGAMNLLNLARDKGARILQSSTSEVYGDPDRPEQREDYRGNVNTVGPRSCYDEGKRAAETLFYEYNHQYGVDVRIARIFNTYGPNMDPDDGRVVSNFVVQALSGKPLTIYGDGLQTRSFCYMSDMIDGLMALMNTEDVPEGQAPITMPVNLGNPGEFTMLELAELVRDITGTHLPLTFRPLPKDDPLQRRPDISRAKAVLGWEPKMPLRQGLLPTISYFRRELQRMPQHEPEMRMPYLAAEEGVRV